MCNGIRFKKKGKKVFLFIQKIEKANLPQKVLLGFLGSILRWRHEDGVYDPELWSQRLARRTRTELLAWGASGSAKTRTHIAPQRKATRKKKLYETKYINYFKKSIKLLTKIRRSHVIVEISKMNCMKKYVM